MNRGRIVQIDTPKAVYQRPTSRFVAEVVGVMNRVQGPVVDGALRLAGGRLPTGGPDQEAALWFRPEAVRAVDPAERTLRGVIVGATFFGATRRLAIDIGTGAPILVDAPASLPAVTGSAVGLAVEPAALIELPDETV